MSTASARAAIDPVPRTAAAPKQSVADRLCDLFVQHGVSVLFGIPGGAILPFYDALYRHGGLRHVLVRHEQGAAHAADGYARATGRPGVCVATSGPGATNLVTGLATALMDGVPMIAVTGQVPTFGRGLDFFQEADVIGITMPVTKHGFLVDDPADLDAVVAEAFAIATLGRPGPVVIDVPKDVQNLPAAAPGQTPVVHHPPVPRPCDEAAIRAAVRRLERAERPLIMAGRGIVASGTHVALHELALRMDAPVVTTLLGLDAFPQTDSRCLGLPGMHGTVRANRAIQRADVILGLGLRFDDRVVGRIDGFAPDAEIIHADIAPSSMGRTVSPAVELRGDLRDTLPRLVRAVTPRQHEEWRAEVAGWPRLRPEPLSTASKQLTGRAASRMLARHLSRTRSIVVTDVGQHQMWIAQELGDADPGTHLTSGGLGTMGYALPAALGAAIARPDRSVWSVVGDGGFQMALHELATAVQERIPVRVAVLNNGHLGMVRQWQDLYHGGRLAASPLSGPDIPALARAYGVEARPVATAHDLAAALEWADSTAGPVLLDIRIPPDEHVYPLIPPGASLDELIEGPGAPV